MFPCGATFSGQCLAVLCDCLDGTAKSCDVEFIDNHPGLALQYLFFKSAHTTCNNRNAASHRFERRQAKSFPSLWRHIQIKQLVPHWHLVNANFRQENQSIRQSCLSYSCLQFVQKFAMVFGCASHNNSMKIRVLRQQLDQGVDKNVGAFLVSDAAITPDQQTTWQA